MPNRPAYDITVSDFGDRVTWELRRDGDRVDADAASLDGLNLDSAFSVAWQQANNARRLAEVRQAQ